MKRFLSSFLLLTLAATPALAASDAQLTVTTSPIATGSVPLGAQRIPMLSATMKASCDQNVHVRSITVAHAGLGASADISRVYAMEGNRRISRAAFIDSRTKVANIRFTPQMILKKCETRTIVIAMDLSASASPGSQHQLMIEFGTDIIGTAEVTLEKEASASVVSAIPASSGSIEFTIVPTSSRNVLFGKDRTLLRFRLKATGAKDQLIDAITLRNDGSATDTDIINLRIAGADSETLSAITPSMDGSLIRITFDPPLKIGRNEQRLMTLRGDVTASRRRTIDLELSEPSDIEARAASRTGN